MSDAVMVTVLVAAVVLIITCLVVGLLALRMFLSRPPRQRAAQAPEPEVQAEAKTEALPMDPDNPPSWKVYSPRKGAPARACACHADRPLVPGQKVLWWPVPKSGGAVNVYCEDGVEV